MTEILPKGHDADTAFDWWDGSRRIIGQEPLDVAVALYTAAPGISRTAATATAHAVPVMKEDDDAADIARRIDTWLRARLEPTALRSQFSLKDDVRAIIAVDGMAECRDLADGLMDHALIIEMSGYAVTMDLERISGGAILCMTAAPSGRPDDRTTIAEIIVGDYDGDEADTPKRTSPELVPA